MKKTQQTPSTQPSAATGASRSHNPPPDPSPDHRDTTASRALRDLIEALLAKFANEVLAGGVSGQWGGGPPTTPNQEFAAHPGGENILRRTADGWEITYAGKTVRVSDSKGMTLIAPLLRRPTVEVPCMELGLESNASVRAQEKARKEVVAQFGGESCSLDGTNPQPVCDKQTIKVVSEELKTLRLELDHATKSFDLVKQEDVRAEIKNYETYLAMSAPNGKPRNFPYEAERARKRVSNAIDRAIEDIRKVHPDCAKHLEYYIETGLYCVYNPNPLTEWTVV
jgi:hypothetical protein